MQGYELINQVVHRGTAISNALLDIVLIVSSFNFICGQSMCDLVTSKFSQLSRPGIWFNAAVVSTIVARIAPRAVWAAQSFVQVASKGRSLAIAIVPRGMDSHGQPSGIGRENIAGIAVVVAVIHFCRTCASNFFSQLQAILQSSCELREVYQPDVLLSMGC